MKDHHRSERARAYVREYVEQHTQLIQAWLEGGGTLEEVGAELILSEVEKFHLNDEPDLRGLAGPYIERIFREAPGGVSFTTASSKFDPYPVTPGPASTRREPRNSVLCHQQRSALVSY